MSGPDMLIVPGALSRAICRQMAKHPTPHGRLDPGGNVTRCDLNPADPALAELVATVGQVVAEAEKEHYKSGATQLAEMKLMKYTPGAYMREHSDNEYEGAQFPGRRSPIARVPYACCFYLTARSKYDGGELNIDGHPPMRPARGEAVFIRGDVLHSVSEITRGTRHIIKVLVTTPPTTEWKWIGRRWHGDL